MSRMASPVKDKNSGVYYFRMAVPKELIPVVKKREIKTSLRTKNLSEAKRAFTAHLTKTQDEFELARLKVSGAADHSLTVRDCIVIAERWYKRVKVHMESTGDFSLMVKRDVERKENGDVSHAYMYFTDTLHLAGSELATASEEDFKQLAEAFRCEIDSQLEIEGIRLSHDNPAYIELGKSFHTYAHHLESVCTARLNNDWNHEPVSMGIYAQPLSDAPEPPAAKPRPVVSTRKPVSENSLQEVLNAYIEVQRSLPNVTGTRLKTLDETKAKVSVFIEIIGNIDISQVQRSDIVHFRDTLYKIPKGKSASLRSKSVDERIALAKEQQLETLSGNTVKVYLRHLSTVFSYAVERDLVSLNPVNKVQVKKEVNKSKTRDDRGYTEQEISIVFNDEVFTDSNAKKPYGQGCYWVPLLCRYTGARVNEIAQLRSEDVCVSDSGIHYLYIREGKNQSVKSESSVREIPLPAHILELGFLDYVSHQQEWLFPELPTNKYGNRGLKVGEWWGKAVRSKGVDIAQPSHAFRHSFKTAMRRLQVADSTSDAITGHAAQTEGGRYGSVPLESKKAAIDLLPRLNIERL
ncbi:site-specific integrase [Salinimonas lutimaris]|uniref:site-specific integrase n=1 Tax=Salinimonas lutimaris TaxID=914153 RepID=UPI0010C12BA4|nr:site-specific integrase [Salinimonas lutimaris]